MISMLNQLFRHQAWADAALLAAVRAHPDAWQDEKLRWTLHHLVTVQRAFLSFFLVRSFDMQNERVVPESLAALEHLSREAHTGLLAFVSNLQEDGLARIIEIPWRPDTRPSVLEAMMQVVLHSQGHRSQCLSRLHDMGGQAPKLDFILWVKDRPEPVWAAE